MIQRCHPNRSQRRRIVLDDSRPAACLLGQIRLRDWYERKQSSMSCPCAGSYHIYKMTFHQKKK